MTNCKNCGHELTDEDVTAAFVKLEGVVKIDLDIKCPECDTQHYTFVNFDDLTTP